MITMDLARMKCTQGTAGGAPLLRRETMDLLGQVPGWSLAEGHLARTYTFPNAAACMAFITTLGEFAGREGHFPDLALREGKHVEVSFYTYPAGGLTLDDFIMAAKLNELGGE